MRRRCRADSFPDSLRWSPDGLRRVDESGSTGSTGTDTCHEKWNSKLRKQHAHCLEWLRHPVAQHDGDPHCAKPK